MACKCMEGVEWTILEGRQFKHYCSYNCLPISLAHAIIKPAMKSCFTVSISLFFFLNFLSVYTRSSEAAPEYLFHACPNTTLFTTNSTYRSNLDTLLSSLSSAATNSTDGFANATAGQNPPDQAYGLFLCRGDVSTATCSDCVSTGKQEILQRCPNQRVSVIWFDECMLRYSNEYIFSVMEEEPVLWMANGVNISDPAKFRQVLGSSIREVAYTASGKASRKKFASTEMNLTSLQKLYTMAQCTPDLMALECNRCLLSAIDILEREEIAGAFTPSCNARFELYPFYNVTAVRASPPPPVATSEGSPPPPHPPPVTTPEGMWNFPSSDGTRKGRVF